MDGLVDETLAWLSGFDLPRHPEVEAKVRLLLLDTLACAAGGFAAPELAALSAGLARSEPGRVRWPGQQLGLAPSGAAFAGTMAACWQEACEGLARAHGRPGLHAVPPAFALAMADEAPLGRLLDAIVWGYELGGRVGEAMRIRPGMHVDGCWGALASAAAAARLRGGDEDAVRGAMALAACQLPTSLYLPVRAGATARNTYAAHAAAMAIFYTAALGAGCTVPPGVFEQAARFVTGEESRSEWPWAEAGTFLILEGYLKPFAAVRHVHYPAQCALMWREQGLEPRTIESVTLETYPEALTYCGNRAPRTAIQAQFSLAYGTAYALSHGDIGPAAYDRAALADPEQNRLEAAVTLKADPSFSGRGARLTVRACGRDWTGSVQAVPGDPGLPLDRAAVTAKAHRYMAPLLAAPAISALVTAILDGPLHQPLGLRDNFPQRA